MTMKNCSDEQEAAKLKDMTKYRSYRIVNGRPRLAIVDENGDMIILI